MIVYASKYGSTGEYAEALSVKLGVPAVRAEEAMPGVIDTQPYLVLGSPIYGFSILPEMSRFIETYGNVLRERPVAAFVVCGDTTWNPRVSEGGSKNLEKLTSKLPVAPFAMAIFGGRMRMEELDDRDRAMILAFYKRIGREATGFDRMELNKVDGFAEEIRRIARSLKTEG